MAAFYTPAIYAKGLVPTFSDGASKPARTALLATIVKGHDVLGLRAVFDDYPSTFPKDMDALDKALVTGHLTAFQVLVSESVIVTVSSD